MDAVSMLRTQMREAHDLLESTLGDITPEQLHFVPPGRALPIGAAYSHVLFSEDILVQHTKGEPPLYESGTATGASEPHPNFMRDDWSVYPAWTHSVRFDLPQLRAYAQRVYANTDAWLAGLTDADLDKADDFLQQNVGHLITRAMIAHADNLTGEISAIKGVQGLQGYPF